MKESELRVNLEPRYDTRKGIYVLTYSGKPPYKIGMTNRVIGKRIGDYINCPSAHDGHYIHFLLTWEIGDDLNAKTVESWIFRKLGKEKRINSTMRARVNNTEHFNVGLPTIKKVLREAQKYYKKEKKRNIYLDEPKKKNVRSSVAKGGKNVAVTD